MKRNHFLKVRGQGNAAGQSPSPKSVHRTGTAKAGNGGPEKRKAPTEWGDSFAVPIYLLDPPEHLARPINDGEYMAELLDSMRVCGQLHPITVEARGARYRIIDGMHRFCAARDMGWTELRAQLRPSGTLPLEAIQLHSNQVHKHMTPWEEHLFYRMLCDTHHLNFEQVCLYTHKSMQYVSDRLLLANLTPESQAALQTDQISFGVAKQLLRLKDAAWERYYLDLCLRTGTGTQVLSGWVTQFLQKKELPTSEQVAKANEPLPAPPPTTAYICAFCNGESGGRTMANVWVHTDELQTICHTIQTAIRAGQSADSAAAAKSEVEKEL